FRNVMSHKIGFTVINWSGHEGSYSAKNLMVDTPIISGWRSTRFCQFPQEITLQLDERCYIRKLQLLAHRYLIPSKIEVHIGDPEPSSHVSFADNENTEFRFRELKTVHIAAVGSYLKLTFHKNHANKYNVNNQVSLVALGIFGDPADSLEVGTALSRDQLIDHFMDSSQNSSSMDSTHTGFSSSKSESTSLFDGLEFDVYLDPEMAHIIRLLNHKKRFIIQEERFDLVRDLKQAIADLQKVGELLGRFDIERHRAIERQDYDTAQQKKEQMEVYRLRVYQQLEFHNLLDISQIHRISELSDFPSSHIETQKHTLHSMEKTNKKKEGHVTEAIEQDASSPKHIISLTSASPAYIPGTDISSLPYDERPLPVLRTRFSDQSVSELHNIAPLVDTGASGHPGTLTEKVQREAILPIEIYGDSLVAGAYSKTWSSREEALLAVYKKLVEVQPGASKAELRSMTRAAVFLCNKALTDKVSSEMALFKKVRALQLVPLELVRPMKSNTPARLALSRLELIEKLLDKLGTKDSGFTLENVMRILAGGFEHCAAPVRELSVKVVQLLYRLHGKQVLNYLPPDDPSTRKNIFYKNLFDSLAKLDGNIAQKSKNGEDGEREKEEIRSLQEQLAVLKEISDEQCVIADVEPDHSGTVNDLDKLCIFCGERDESFNEEGLDLHYWKHCPMLQRCLQCGQVVEIASLTEHLLTECERRTAFSQCPLCSEALLRDKLTEHAHSSACNPSIGNCSHCPLCHENFASGEEGWKSHLMGPEGCKKNSRRRDLYQNVPSRAQGKRVNTAGVKATMVISKSKTRGLGGGTAPASRSKV
ncbi:hypothetical protein DNTS_000055, partial [Danionella cerebrum]